jgi:hypothetical protein
MGDTTTERPFGRRFIELRRRSGDLMRDSTTERPSAAGSAVGSKI